MRVKGVCALACCGALSRVQVRVSPCGARGGAGRSRTAVWKGTKDNMLYNYVFESIALNMTTYELRFLSVFIPINIIKSIN